MNQYLTKTIQYFADCYKADNREQRLYDFFSNKIDLPCFVDETEELLNQTFPFIVLNPEYGSSVLKNQSIYGKEKDFIYASVFIIGQTVDGLGSTQKICTPLFWHPAKVNFIEENDHYAFSIDLSKRIINFSVLNALRSEENEQSDVIDLQAQFPKGKMDFPKLTTLGKILQNWNQNIEVEELYLFPKLFNEKEVKQHRKSTKLHVVPASAFGLLNKSKQTLGILNEMQELSRETNCSTALESLFIQNQALVTTTSTNSPRLSRQKTFTVPAILSKAQEAILKAADDYHLSLVVGPPGTGKSFTVASLAVNLMAEGKSVLIASRTNQAVDVIGDKIEQQLNVKNAIVRGGSSKYLKELKTFLGNLLSGILPEYLQGAQDFLSLKKSAAELERSWKVIQEEYKQKLWLDKERSTYLRETEHRWKPFKLIKTKWIEYKLDKEKTADDLVLELEAKDIERIKLASKLLEAFRSHQLRDSLRNIRERRSLSNFLSAIRARTGNLQEERFQTVDLNVLTKVFPIWLVNLNDLSKVLPLEKELFDVLIIDEATQCDIAICLPALQRAKRVVFAGDPKQLRHVSFLSFARMKELREQYELPNRDQYNFREFSVLDLVQNAIQSQEQVAFLNEHFRSEPDIIRFSNEHFYQNNLRVMTAKPSSHLKKNIEFVQCDGIRNKRGFNEVEAEAVLKYLKTIIEEQAAFKMEDVWTIGLLSPFRDQVDFMAKLIEKALSLNEITRHQIKIGTAYSFQGDERDIVLLSLAVDNQSHTTAIRHINQPALFNVAITRAKKKQVVFFSRLPQNLKQESLFYQYLHPKEKKTLAHKTSEVETEITSFLKNENCQVYFDFEIAGTTLDLLVTKGEHFFGIDLVGFENNYENLTIDEHRILHRAGIDVYPLAYSDWKLKRNVCERVLRRFIK